MAKQVKPLILKIDSSAGIDAVVAQNVVNVASEYESDMVLRYRDKEVDLKSILGIMSLAVIRDSNVEVIATGDDAAEALAAIQKVLDQNA